MRVLFVGLGSIAAKHIAALHIIDNSIEIYALRRNQNAKEILEVIDIYSLEEIPVGLFDFIVISNPTAKHVETIEQLLFLHCPLFIEKPVSNDLNFEIILRKISEQKLLTYVSCNLRYLDALRFISNHLQNNPTHRINEVNVYCGSYLPEWRPNTDFRTIYSAQKNLGGGVHIDLIHEIDYIYWLFGVPIKVSKTFRNKSTLNIDAFDYANYCMDYPNFCVNAILNYYRRDSKREMEIVFEDQTWIVDLLNNKIKTSDQEILFESNQKISDTYQIQMEYFIDLIRKREVTSFNSINVAFEVLKICLEDES